MDFIRSVKTLEALYGQASPASLHKVADHLTPLYQAWIGAARFCVLSTIGPAGTDGSPLGDLGRWYGSKTIKRFYCPIGPAITVWTVCATSLKMVAFH